MDFTFLHHPKPKQFEYQPRYYNAEKDKDKERGYEPDETEKFARKLHSNWQSKRTQQHKSALSPTTILIMVVVLAFLLFFIFH